MAPITAEQVKRGACSGHQGVKQWHGTASTTGTTLGSAASGAGAAAPSTTPPASSPHTSAAPPAQEPTQPRTAPTTRTPQAGGNLGTVWLHTATNVYHCPGSQYYGKTKAGAYRSETEARAKGARPERGKSCMYICESSTGSGQGLESMQAALATPHVSHFSA